MSKDREHFSPGNNNPGSLQYEFVCKTLVNNVWPS